MKLFRLAQIYLLIAGLLTGGCVNKELPGNLPCQNSDLSIILVGKTDATTCKSIDGQLEVTGTGGTGPYDYKIGDGIYQTNPVFIHLGAGTYSITAKDAKGCKMKLSVAIGAANSTLAATFNSTSDTKCMAPHEGTITVTPSGGSLPYLIKLDDGLFGSAVAFTALQSGTHTAIVKDGQDCELVLNITVDRGNTGVSYATQIQPMLTAACNFPSCHGSGSGGRDWTSLSNVQAKAGQIKSRTGNRSMPIGTGPSLTDQQIQLIACWVDDGANNN